MWNPSAIDRLAKHLASWPRPADAARSIECVLVTGAVGVRDNKLCMGEPK